MVKIALVYRLFVVLVATREGMVGRRGLWLCPTCNKHQTWKSRDSSTSRLDRKCISCSQRIRVTLDRSGAGRGRTQQARVWERKASTPMKELEQEALLRDRETNAINIENTPPDKSSAQQDLPPLWGADWLPTSPLIFSQKINSKEVRNELIRFVIERHDGYVEVITECWDLLNASKSFTGENYHEFCQNFNYELSKKLRERIFEPEFANLADEEIIPRRSGTTYLNRRVTRLLRDVALCLRRIAYKASITVEQRFDWDKRIG